jgi:hypothetical protein
MKELVFRGVTLQYTVDPVDAEYGYGFVTDFYLGEEEVTRRKYILFGEKITTLQPKFAFRLWMDIEDPVWTKKGIRNAIANKMELMNRRAEIERGEII